MSLNIKENKIWMVNIDQGYVGWIKQYFKSYCNEHPV